MLHCLVNTRPLFEVQVTTGCTNQVCVFEGGEALEKLLALFLANPWCLFNWHSSVGINGFRHCTSTASAQIPYVRERLYWRLANTYSIKHWTNTQVSLLRNLLFDCQGMTDCDIISSSVAIVEMSYKRSQSTSSILNIIKLYVYMFIYLKINIYL